ncbi:MAG: 50S ribosomal protein L33 [Thermaerobacterales bacterium]
MRVIVTLECSSCRRRNYTSTKNRRTTTARLELKKYCKWCSGHVLHRETR